MTRGQRKAVAEAMEAANVYVTNVNEDTMAAQCGPGSARTAGPWPSSC